MAKGLVNTMDDVGRYLWSAIFLILLIAIAMFFSGSEISIVSLSESKLKRLAEEENSKAKKLLKLKERQFDFTLWVNTSAVLCITAVCCYGTYIFAPTVRNLLEKAFGEASWIHIVSLIITFVVTAFLAFVFGQTLPKKLVANDPEKFAYFSIPLLKLLSCIFKPLTFLILKTTRGLTKLFGVDPNIENSDITEEEIRMLVDVGNENGTIELSEREMINNIFEFDNITVGEVMTHRTDLVTVEKNVPLSEVIKLATEEGFSRIPVYDEVIDNIVGILYVKDLLSLLGTDDFETKQTKDFIRNAIYVPESTRCRMLFKEFKEKKTHLAVVVDEYGGTAGIATMEDLIESIVGNIQDEYDQEEEEIKKIDDSTYSLDGSIDIEDVEELFDINIVADEDTDTLSGFIVDTLGRIPLENETPSVTIENVEFTVLLVEDRRIVRVKARKLPPIEYVEE